MEIPENKPNYKQLATNIIMHAKTYIPVTWKRKIDEYFPVRFRLSAEEAEILAIGNKIGALEKAIKYVYKNNGNPDLKKWYIKDAIRDFFWSK